MAKSSPRSAFEKFVARAMEEPSFLGHAVQTFSCVRAMTFEDVAEFLGCDTIALQKLALCRNTCPGDDSYSEDVAQIASFVGCNPGRLDQLLRESTGVAMLRESRPSNYDARSLLAARDRASHDSDDEVDCNEAE